MPLEDPLMTATLPDNDFSLEAILVYVHSWSLRCRVSFGEKGRCSIYNVLIRPTVPSQASPITLVLDIREDQKIELDAPQ